MLAVREVETIHLAMMDGVTLATDIYRPEGQGNWPVLVMRLPYGRKVASTVVLAHPAWYAAQGYVVVIQDVRGRGASGGVFRLLEDDVSDGAETLAFAAGLAGGNGQVATYGFSYHGMNQYLGLAGARRAGTKAPDAMAIAMAAFDVRNHWAYEGGAFRMQLSQEWACQMAVENARLAGDMEMAHRLRAAMAGLPHGPVPARPAVLEEAARYTHYQDWLADDPAYWQRISPHAVLDGVTLEVPALHVGGWNDFMLEGTLAAFRAFSQGTARQRLTIGPWAHIPWGQGCGLLPCGEADAIGIDVEIVAFFDEVLKGRDNSRAPVHLFDPGRNAWKSFGSWPAAEEDTLHLGSTGRAAPTVSDGLLRPVPATGSIDRLVHDPWRPAPAVGLHLGTPGVYADRAAVDDRSDVAVYTGTPLQRAMTLAGAPVLMLQVTADRPSFDLDATIGMVDPDGVCIALTSAHLHVPEARENALTLTLRPTFVTVPANYRLRLSLQAAAFPAFPVNPGTGARPQDATVMDGQVTTLTILLGEGTGSRLELPFLPSAHEDDTSGLEDETHEG